jgi:hypothetical protein
LRNPLIVLISFHIHGKIENSIIVHFDHRDVSKSDLDRLKEIANKDKNFKLILKNNGDLDVIDQLMTPDNAVVQIGGKIFKVKDGMYNGYIDYLLRIQ